MYYILRRPNVHACYAYIYLYTINKYFMCNTVHTLFKTVLHIIHVCILCVYACDIRCMNGKTCDTPVAVYYTRDEEKNPPGSIVERRSTIVVETRNKILIFQYTYQRLCDVLPTLRVIYMFININLFVNIYIYK